MDSAREEHKTKDNYTQTSEEKTDEVGWIPTTTLMKLLKNCGLEIVLQNGNYYLVLCDRDKLTKWIENETDGKVSVAFEKTPVYERFVQTDIKMIGEKTQCGECAECKAIIIELKKKIVDQANTIKRFREYQANMPTDSLRGQRSGLKKVLSVEVQTVGKLILFIDFCLRLLRVLVVASGVALAVAVIVVASLLSSLLLLLSWLLLLLLSLLHDNPSLTIFSLFFPRKSIR